MTGERIWVETNRCILCRACQIACEREHDGRPRIHVMPVRSDGAVPLLCRHCRAAPCTAACPTGALAPMRAGQPVVFLEERCTGCSLCVFACPFGVLDGPRPLRVITQCDLCRHRLDAKSLPACVLTCPTGALRFGSAQVPALRNRRRETARIVEATRVSSGRPAGRKDLT